MGCLPDTEGSDIFIAKHSLVGEHLWSAGFGGNDDDDALGLAIRTNGDVVFWGNTESDTIDFGGKEISKLFGTATTGYFTALGE